MQPGGQLCGTKRRTGRSSAGVTGLKRCRDTQALTPGSAMSEWAVRGRLHTFVFGGRPAWTVQLAGRTRTVTGGLCGCAAISPDPGFEAKELGGIDMVTHDDAPRALIG